MDELDQQLDAALDEYPLEELDPFAVLRYLDERGIAPESSQLLAALKRLRARRSEG